MNVLFPDSISTDVGCAICERLHPVLPKSYKYHYIVYDISVLIFLSCLWHRKEKPRFKIGPISRHSTRGQYTCMYVCGFLGQGNFTFLLTTMLSGIVLSGIVQYWQWLNGVLHLNPLVLLWESRLCVCQIYYGKYLSFRQQINLLWVKGIKSLKRVSVLNNDMFLQSQWMYICIFEETCSISLIFYFAILKIKVRGLVFFVTILNKSYLNVIRNVNDVRYRPIHVLSLWCFMKYSNIK